MRIPEVKSIKQFRRLDKIATIANEAIKLGIDFTLDYHQLNSTSIDIILKLAKDNHYYKPYNANGSIARYYYQRLQRAILPHNYSLIIPH